MMKLPYLLGVWLAFLAIAWMGCRDVIADAFGAPAEGLHAAHAGHGEVIPGRYIVVLDGGLGLSAGASHADRLHAVRAMAGETMRRHGVAGMVDQVYAQALVGFSGAFSDADIRKLMESEEVAYVESDRMMPVMEGRGACSQVIAGVDYVAAEGAPGDVASLSLGASISEALGAAMTSAARTGIRFVAPGHAGRGRHGQAMVYTIAPLQADRPLAAGGLKPGMPMSQCRRQGVPMPLSVCAGETPCQGGIRVWGAEKDGGVACSAIGMLPAPMGQAPLAAR